ncbi:PLP-dependent transferase [Leucobacter tenebrionis]|uniref:PLP-dependent transferase n=1 Tax=Leucobacter tenebrionis TaxID=2873270 RepID=UPI0037429D18
MKQPRSGAPTFGSGPRFRICGLPVVVHSATKFIAGHSDVLLGLVVARNAELRARLARHRTLHGGIPASFHPAFLRHASLPPRLPPNERSKRVRIPEKRIAF